MRPGTDGSWFVPLVAGYRAAPGQETWALAILNHMLASRQWNPQWDEAMRGQLREALARQAKADAEVGAMLQQQSWEFHNMLMAQGDAAQAARTANHNAFMAQMNAQSAQRNAEFQRYEAQKDLNTWRFTAQIRNGALYRDVNTGEIFEVDQ